MRAASSREKAAPAEKSLRAGPWCVPGLLGPGFPGVHVGFAFGFFTPSRSHACRTPWSVFQDGTIVSLLVRYPPCLAFGMVAPRPPLPGRGTACTCGGFYTPAASGLSSPPGFGVRRAPSLSPFTPDFSAVGERALRITSVRGTTLLGLRGSAHHPVPPPRGGVGGDKSPGSFVPSLTDTGWTT